MIHRHVTNTGRQTIRTKNLSMTETKQRRVKASASGSGNKETVTIEYDDEISYLENHDLAAGMLLSKLGWSNKKRLIGGHGGYVGYVYVVVDKEEKEYWIPAGYKANIEEVQNYLYQAPWDDESLWDILHCGEELNFDGSYDGSARDLNSAFKEGASLLFHDIKAFHYWDKGFVQGLGYSITTLASALCEKWEKEQDAREEVII